MKLILPLLALLLCGCESKPKNDYIVVYRAEDVARNRIVWDHIFWDGTGKFTMEDARSAIRYAKERNPDLYVTLVNVIRIDKP